MQSRRPSAWRLGVLCAAAVTAIAAAPAATQAATPVAFERIAGVTSPGTPAKYDKVGILRIGARSAPNVLVLNPGTSSSAAYFAPMAKTVVQQAPDWQVWAVERRENLLEDHSMFNRGKAGTATSAQVFGYYLGYLDDDSITDHFQFIPDADVAYAKQWGMATQMGDLRKVVQKAKKQADHVVVGGHSLGGTMTTAYATWDFGGTAGAKGLDGLVYIDGASRTEPMTVEQAQEAMANLDAGSPWLTFGGIPAPFTGLFNTSGALGVLTAGDEPSLGQQFGLLPADLKPPVPATNAGQYGYALDVGTSPAGLGAAQAHLGQLAPSGDPRGWISDEITPLKRYATMFSGFPLKSLDGTAWYHPLRLTIDAGAVANGNANPAQDVLGVKATHGADLPKDLRILAFGASLGGPRVGDAAHALAKQSGIPRRNVTALSRRSYAHNDPNSAYPKNVFLARLVPFLKRIGRG